MAFSQLSLKTKVLLSTVIAGLGSYGIYHLGGVIKSKYELAKSKILKGFRILGVSVLSIGVIYIAFKAS